MNRLPLMAEFGMDELQDAIKIREGCLEIVLIPSAGRVTPLPALVQRRSLQLRRKKPRRRRGKISAV